MQIMFGTILCVLLKDLILTKAIITFIPKDYTPSNSLQEENVSICPNLNFTQDISIFEKSDHHILNFKSDRSHSDSTVRNKREDDEVTNTNVSIIPESIESSLSKPTSLRAFVQFNSQFAEKVNDIFVTLRWNQPEFINEIIQGYTVQCFFIEDLKEIQTCDDKNIITTKLEHTGVVKSGCKEYNLPTIIYTISVSCLDNNLNKSEKFEVLTAERYYEIQNLTPFTEYKLKYTLSNFYFDQLSINPFDSNVISMKTNSGKLNAPENVSALALKPTIAVVHWMPLKKVNCVAATYEVHWKSVTLANGTQQKGKQFINMPKRTADGRFFTKIHLSLPIQDYLIYVRVYPNNFSDFYNESLSKIDHIYSDPNNITLSEVEINSMDISWISNINLTISPTLEYKENATEKWQTTNYIKINYNKEIIYHIENLQSGTLYKFRLILRYPEYEENFIWPADERFIFSTLDISGTPGIIAKKYYLILMLGFIVIVTIICVCYFYRLHRERRYNNEQFLSSTDMELAILDEVSCQYTEFNTIYSPMLHCNPDECAITKIARKQITFTKLLGSGAFGMVFQGKVKNLEGSSTEISVAIKTLRKDASSREKKNLLKEAKLMNHFRHKHILRLLAVCLDGDSPLLVLELMETGDLLKYLRDCRNLQASDSPALRLQDLLAMCEDVARGCCYLEELRFVHRDLACRNCLVSSKNRENRVIKIGDFGLARDIYKGDYYRVKGQGLLPIRWMAPESLMIRIFTSQSDVWSFGVLMWEITSLGEQPYIAKTDEEVINYVRAGGRLPIALNCPSPLYQLMLRCWSAADARPNFKFCLENIIALRKNIEDTLLNPVDTI
ncbi:proto-oncogene tyrosine-protein kinase ROS-like isoform X6 [Camponotus floridanus]|uniref:proto-oncogene tyrosine-protein kinase ROS-like isoform X6 n=1 Tax=Camponotus floridanus TaxID=104421 RepID=UPI000DC680D4|nr:proto-oncogene tyrosine-protein kinase ROS-like isoform X6 [Camponotus floridanus]